MKGSASLKAVNAVVSVLMIVLLALHGLGNALQLFGFGSIVPSVISWALVLLAALHFAMGIALTVSTLSTQKRAGAAYWRQNKRFWTVRASGLAIVVFIICHVLLFARFDPDAPVRLAYFGPLQLAASLLLVASLLVHVLANLQPLMISLGVPAPPARAVDVSVVVALLLLATAIAFVVYFLRWSVV